MDYRCQGCSQPMTPETLLVCQQDHLARFDEQVAYAFCVPCYFVHCASWQQFDHDHEVFLQ